MSKGDRSPATRSSSIVTMEADDLKLVMVSIPQFQKITGLADSTIRKAIREATLGYQAKKIGGSWRILIPANIAGVEA